MFHYNNCYYLQKLSAAMDATIFIFFFIVILSSWIIILLSRDKKAPFLVVADWKKVSFQN